MAEYITDKSCIFCKIIAGDIPCHKLYEDERVLAFLDIGPLTKGHCLVIPKDHYQRLELMEAELAGRCMEIVVKLGKAVLAGVGDECGAWNVLQNNGEIAGQAVGHVHFHIIPRKDGDGLGYRWPAGELSGEDAKQLLEAITARLE